MLAPEPFQQPRPARSSARALQRGKLDQAREGRRRRRRAARRSIEIHQGVEQVAVVRVGFERMQQFLFRVRELAHGSQRPRARYGARAFRHVKDCNIRAVNRLVRGTRSVRTGALSQIAYDPPTHSMRVTPTARSALKTRSIQ